MSPSDSPQGSQPYAATDFMPLFPQRIGAWRRAAAYPRLQTVGPGDGSATAAGHYRSGAHVVVVTVMDLQETSAQVADPSLAGTHELPDGTMIVEQLRGRWVQERAYHPPYNDKVVGGFSYNMRLSPEAQPQTDECAVALTLSLRNGILVTVKGPADTTLPMLKEVLEGIDLGQAEHLPRGTAPDRK